MNKVYYSWECPPRVLDKEGVLDFNVDLEKVFNGEKIDNFTELPKLVEFREIESKFLEECNGEYYKIIADSNSYFLSPESLEKYGYGSTKEVFLKFKKMLQEKCNIAYGVNKVKVVLFTELVQEYLPLYYSLFLNYSKKVGSLVTNEEFVEIRKYLKEHVGIIDSQKLDEFTKSVIVSYIVEGVIIPMVFPESVWINFDEPVVLAEMTNKCNISKIEIKNSLII